MTRGDLGRLTMHGIASLCFMVAAMIVVEDVRFLLRVLDTDGALFRMGMAVFCQGLAAAALCVTVALMCLARSCS